MNNQVTIFMKVCGYIPNAGMQQWPNQGNNPIFTKKLSLTNLASNNKTQKGKRGKKEQEILN